MKKIRLKREDEGFPDDITKIVESFARLDLECSRADAEAMWSRYSEEHYAAGWLGLFDEDRIPQRLAPYYEVES